ncbi:MAG: KpsF/GutQ family sugar-phosphate isomerase [Elusimicrobia bacterium]|nr:KpsF/GutQ family sugar-phosphate isomerase [Elusimicrobiota bacterium]
MINREKILQQAKRVLKIESEAVAGQVKHVGAEFFRCVTMINSVVESGSGRVVITGMGKSGIIARKLSAMFSSLGAPSLFVHPAEMSHGDLGMLTPSDILIVLSYSGESEELKKIIPSVKNMGTPIISMTGRKNSFITRFSDAIIDVSVKKEACPYDIVPTSSTTAMLAIGDALAIVIAGIRGFKKEDFARLHPGGLLGKKLNLKVRQLMHTGKDNPVIKQNLTVAHALDVMTKTKLGAVSVVDGRGVLAGYFTDGDLRRQLRKDRDILSRKISEVMTVRPKRIKPDDMADTAAGMIKKYNCDNLPVVDSNGRPVGIIDERDLIVAGIM